MPVNKEELVTDLDNPEYLTLVKETLAKKEFTIQDKTEHASYLERVKGDVIEKELPNKVKAIYDNLDKDVKDLFGVDREPNEKSYEYLKRVGSSTLKGYKDKIQELDQAIASGKGGEAIQRRLEEEQNKWKAKQREYEERLAQADKEKSVMAKASDIKLVYGELKKSFIKDKPALFERVEKSVLDEVIANSIMKDNKLVMINSDGTVRKDSHFNEITVEDYLRSEFKDLIEKKREQGGSGSSGGNNPDPSIDPKALTPENFPMKATLKKKSELTDYMISLGLKQGTKEFQAIWTKFGVPLTEL